MKLLKTIYKSLQAETAISNMRINTTMIVLTGCICILINTIIFAIAFYRGSVSATDILAFGTVITSFTGVGIWGKAAQKKTETQQLNN